MHQNMSLGSNGMDWVCWLRKIPTRLRGTNFCTSSARFAPSFKSKPNGAKCTKIVCTHQNMSLGSNGVDRVCSLRKILTHLRGTTFCTSSARFAPSFKSLPNGSKCTKIVRNAPKHEFRVQWDGSGAFISKILMRLRATNFITCSARFAPSFVSQPKGLKCTKIVRNAPKHEFRVQWCGIGAFGKKNFDSASWHELLHQFGPFCTEFRKSTKRSEMQQNFIKCTKTFV